MTAWQNLCADLAKTHHRDPWSDCCTECGDGYPCARARMAAPVVAASDDPLFLAFSATVSGRCSEAAGHPPRPTAGRRI